jgi:chitin synthase
MGLLSIILTLMGGVGFLSFGFQTEVCSKPVARFPAGNIGRASVIIHGLDYNFTSFKHPKAGTTFDGGTNPLIEGGWNLAGNDASFLFQKVNENCQGLVTKASTSSITGSGGNLNWYFPCNIYNTLGTSGVNLTGYEVPTSCHITTTARLGLRAMRPLGQVFYTWDQVQSQGRNLAVFES